MTISREEISAWGIQTYLQSLGLKANDVVKDKQYLMNILSWKLFPGALVIQ